MASGVDDIQQSLRILLGTAPGERVMQETFGCDMSRMLFEELDQRLIGAARDRIKSAIILHEPRIKLDRVDVAPSATESGCLVISVAYTVVATNSRFNMVFPFYLMEATRAGGG
jgi:phage baseplate assembly protein W